MKFSLKHFVRTLSLAILAASAAVAGAAPVAFTEPSTWSVGDVGSTYQQWDAVPAPITITNNLDHNANPGTGTPTIGVTGGFVASSGGYYAFGGNYTVTAAIPNAGVAGPGTHVLVQTGASLNPDYQPEEDGTGGSVLRDTIKILDADNNVLATSNPADVTRSYYNPTMLSSFGEVQYEELAWSVYLPGYTGDFKVVFDVIVHSSFSTLRVDSNVAAVPEPGTIALLGTGLVGLTIVGLRRRNRS